MGHSCPAAELQQLELGFAERWLLQQLNAAIRGCQDSLERFRFSDYVTAAYRFFRDDLCDWYLEWAKHQFKQGGAAADTASAVPAMPLTGPCACCTPGMPYITELLWQQLQGVIGSSPWQDDQFLMIDAWPEVVACFDQDGISEAWINCNSWSAPSVMCVPA